MSSANIVFLFSYRNGFDGSRLWADRLRADNLARLGVAAIVGRQLHFSSFGSYDGHAGGRCSEHCGVPAVHHGFGLDYTTGEVVLGK